MRNGRFLSFTTCSLSDNLTKKPWFAGAFFCYDFSIMPNLLIANETDNGYSWTLTSRLGQMLREIEFLYGERDKSYTLLGIEFQKDSPCNWYPGNCKHVIIQLSLSSQTNLPCALFELAHEAVHLLSPQGKQVANHLEEGLATFYSWHYMKKTLNLDYSHHGTKKYQTAALMVQKLLSLRADFFIEARKFEPIISKISASLIMQLCPEFDEDMAQILTSSFYPTYAPSIVSP